MVVQNSHEGHQIDAARERVVHGVAADHRDPWQVSGRVELDARVGGYRRADRRA